MTECGVCGRTFNPLRFQVVVPGLGQGFDRVACAEQARALAGAQAAPALATPLVEAFPTAPAAAPAPAGGSRLPVLLGANLALLAAGTAATAYLWFRVFGADPSALELSDLSAAQAFEHATVPAHIAPRRPESASAPTAVPSGRPSTPAPSVAESSPVENGGSEPTLVSNPPRSGDGNGPALGPGTGGSPEPPPAPGAGPGSDGDEPGTEPARPAGHETDDEDDDEGHEHGDDEDDHGDDEDDHGDDEDEHGEHGKSHEDHGDNDDEGHGKANGHEKAHGKGHHGGPGKKEGHKKYD